METQLRVIVWLVVATLAFIVVGDLFHRLDTGRQLRELRATVVLHSEALTKLRESVEYLSESTTNQGHHVEQAFNELQAAQRSTAEGLARLAETERKHWITANGWAR